MSNCNTCVKLNPLPGCIDSEEFFLTGLTFPDYLSQTIKGILHDVATGRADEFDIAVDGAGVPTMDIAEFYPLSNHPYKIEFLKSGAPANFLLTNPDTTTAEGCCIEFGVMTFMTGSDTYVLSSQGCAVETSSSSSSGCENCLSDEQFAAIPDNASGSNQLVTEDDLPSALTTPYVTPEQYGALNSTDTFAGLGITQPTIDATYPGTGATTADTVDWAAMQYAIIRSIADSKYLATRGEYYLNRGVVVTPTAYKSLWKWDGNGGVINTTNTDVFTVVTVGMPTQQSGGGTSYTNADILVENTYDISGIVMECADTQTGFEFGPSYSSRFSQLIVTGAAVGIVGYFNLKARYELCNMRDCNVSIRLQSGDTVWTGATTSNSQSNHSNIADCRAVWSADLVGADIGFDIIDSGGVRITDCILEGSRIKRGVNWYSELTTVYNLRVINTHYECTQGTLDAGNDQAFVYARVLGGMLIIDGAYGQYGAILADTGLSTGGAWLNVKIINTEYWVLKSARGLYNAGNCSYIFVDNDNPFKTTADVEALTAGTAITECGGDGCGNNKYYLYALPR